MHFDAFDSYQHRDSPVHRLDPRTKIICTVLLILSTVLLPEGAWAGFAISWLLILATAMLAGVELRFLLTRSLIAAPFALAALTVVFTIPGYPIATIPLGPFSLTISDAGLVRFAGVVLRSWLAVQAAILLTISTPFPDLIHALRHLRMPAVITGIISFMYRYLFVLGDESLRLIRGRASRSGSLGDRPVRTPLLWRARVAGAMIGQLFLRSYARSDRVYKAMQARGYEGQLMTMNPHKMTPVDWVSITLFGFVLILIHIALIGA